MNEMKRSGILPREAGAAPLDIVITIMALLATLALGGVLIAGRNVATWEGGLTGRLTVQILPEDTAPPAAEVEAALRVLRGTEGVALARALTDEENLRLVEPWLGRDAMITALPFPRVIDVSLEPGAPVDVAALAERLMAAAPHAILDDHSRWVERLRAAATGVIGSALAILLLIAIATVAIVAFATRAGMAAYHEIVELLHVMGARDRFISGAFERHYFRAALMSAALGCAAGALLFLAAGALTEIGVAGVPFLPPLGLRLLELPWLLSVPFGAAVIAWLTARLSVLAALRRFY